MAKKRIGPRIEPAVEEYLKTVSRSVNAGAEYAIQSFPPLYRRTLMELKGRFTEDELKLIIDVMKGTKLMPTHAGNHLIANVEDGIALDGLDKKWGANPKEKLRELTVYQVAALEIWATSFWQAAKSEHEGPDSLNNYIRQLL